MKKILFVLFILLLGLVIEGCNSIDSANNKRVLIDELTPKGKVMYYESKPFNGICFDVWDNGELKVEIHYKSGVKDGLEIEWYDNGEIANEINYKNGELIKDFCDCWQSAYNMYRFSENLDEAEIMFIYKDYDPGCKYIIEMIENNRELHFKRMNECEFIFPEDTTFKKDVCDCYKEAKKKYGHEDGDGFVWIQWLKDPACLYILDHNDDPDWLYDKLNYCK